MKQRIKKVISFIFSLLIIFSTMFNYNFDNNYVFAADGLSDTLKPSMSKKAEAYNGTDEFKVKFNFPSQDAIVDSKKADVVIVMDKSSVADLGGFTVAAQNMIDELANKTNSDIKVGVIWFNAYVNKGTEGLLSLNNADNRNLINTALTQGNGAGTNIHGAIKLADEWLSADTTVAHK